MAYQYKNRSKGDPKDMNIGAAICAYIMVGVILLAVGFITGRSFLPEAFVKICDRHSTSMAVFAMTVAVLIIVLTWPKVMYERMKNDGI